MKWLILERKDGREIDGCVCGMHISHIAVAAVAVFVDAFVVYAVAFQSQK